MEVRVIWRTLLMIWILAGVASSQEEVFDRTDPIDDNMKTGVAIGETIPPFEAVDQNGKSWSFDSIKGRNGAVILFYRSADW